MPIYEYVCLDCNNKFEELVLKNDANVKCPKCSSGNTKKLMSTCRAKVAGGASLDNLSSSTSSSCSGCSGGNCSTCGG
ncbi:hypothetical protein JCM13304A_13450 [Desulfothermus okinawensis JCM 13304]